MPAREQEVMIREPSRRQTSCLSQFVTHVRHAQDFVRFERRFTLNRKSSRECRTILRCPCPVKRTIPTSVSGVEETLNCLSPQFVDDGQAQLLKRLPAQRVQFVCRLRRVDDCGHGQALSAKTIACKTDDLPALFSSTRRENFVGSKCAPFSPSKFVIDIAASHISATAPPTSPHHHDPAVCLSQMRTISCKYTAVPRPSKRGQFSSNVVQTSPATSSAGMAPIDSGCPSLRWISASLVASLGLPRCSES